MNDENFDKIFGDKLNAGKDFSFSEEKWDKMERNLAAFQAKRRWQRLARWLSLPLLALVGLLAWGGWALFKTQQNIHDLTQEVQILRQQKRTSNDTPSVSAPNWASETPQTVVKSDTVYHHIVVKRYDTIFQTVVRRDLLGASQNQDILPKVKKDYAETVLKDNTATENRLKPSVNDSFKTNYETKIDTKETTTPLSISTSKEEKIEKKTEISQEKPVENTATPLSISTNQQEKIEKKTEISQEKPVDNTATPLSISTSQQEKTEGKTTVSQEKTIATPIETQKNKLLSIIKPLKMGGFEIGLSSGMAVIGNKNILHQDGFSMGGRIGILLNKRLKLVGDIQRLELNYEADNFNNSLDIPVISPPTTNDVLKNVYAEQSYMQYSVGLQYVLLQKKLQPYIGLSILGQSKMEEKFDYQFRNSITGETSFIKTMRGKPNFEGLFLRPQIGVEYPIFRKFRAQLEGSSDINLGKMHQSKPIFQLKGAILYRF